MIKAEQVQIRWDESLPVFAKEEFLKAVGDEYGWIGGVDSSGRIRCVLPFTVLRKAGFRLVRFRTATIPMGNELDLEEERIFLNNVVQHFRGASADIIVPATNNAVFRTFPNGAMAAPYGTYIVDLRESLDTLWRNMGDGTRRDIKSAQRSGITILEGDEFLPVAYRLIRETFGRSQLPFMSESEFNRFAHGLGVHKKLIVAEYNGSIHSCVLFAFSRACAYAVYGGNVPNQQRGANKLIYWHAFQHFRERGVQRLDFFGARIDPEKGSKQERINNLKKGLGAVLQRGYAWKYPIRRLGSYVYALAVRLFRGGDIVDQERHKLYGYRVSAKNTAQ